MMKKGTKNEIFSPNLDFLSENILYLLSFNSRLTITDLSKNLGVSRKLVETRVEKLYSGKFIKPLLIYNYDQLLKATILIKLTRFTSKVFNSITQLKKLVKLKETIGEYDLSLLVMVKDREELEKFLGYINQLFHESLKTVDVVLHDFEDTLGYKSFLHDQKLFTPCDLDRKSLIHLNSNELLLVDYLKKTPNSSYKQMLLTLNLSHLKIKEIINDLVQKRVLRFSIDPNYALLGLEFHNVLVRVNLGNASIFEKNIIKHPRIHWVKKGIGRWDYILSITSKNLNEFIEICREIRTTNEDSILDFTTLISNIHVERRE